MMMCVNGYSGWKLTLFVLSVVMIVAIIAGLFWFHMWLVILEERDRDWDHNDEIEEFGFWFLVYFYFFIFDVTISFDIPLQFISDQEIRRLFFEFERFAPPHRRHSEETVQNLGLPINKSFLGIPKGQVRKGLSRFQQAVYQALIFFGGWLRAVHYHTARCHHSIYIKTINPRLFWSLYFPTTTALSIRKALDTR